MTLTLNLAPEVVEAIAEAALQRGQTREDLAADALQRLFAPDNLAENAFLMGAEGTRHVWDTPEEDQAWAHLAQSRTRS